MKAEIINKIHNDIDYKLDNDDYKKQLSELEFFYEDIIPKIITIPEKYQLTIMTDCGKYYRLKFKKNDSEFNKFISLNIGDNIEFTFHDIYGIKNIKKA